MVALVTLDEARDQLMVDSTAVNPWLNMMIPAISQAVLAWLKDEWRAYELAQDSAGDPLTDSNGDPIVFLDSAGEPLVKPMVKAATLIELASQFRFRDGDGVKNVPDAWGHGHVLCMGATALLVPLRKPTSV
jgi:hypothetical protein